MIKQLFNKIISLLKENYKYIFFLAIGYVILTYPLPYYIHTAGGLIDISERVEIENEYDKKGSFNLSYVTEINGSVITCLLSYIIPNWDLVKQEEYVASNETYEDVYYRNHLLLEEANANATIVAYKAASKEIVIKEERYYVAYIDELASTTLMVGDEIVSIEGIQVNGMSDYLNVVESKKIGDNVNVTVVDRNGNTQKRKAKVFDYDGSLRTGIVVTPKYEYEAKPNIEFNFKESESGPSGGLMMTLAIYNKLVKEDLTKGLKIVGTGTIDIDGNVGEISGIEYKLKGAVNAKADIFLAPAGENYDDAMKEVKKNNYDIKVVGVSTFADALNYLRSV